MEKNKTSTTPTFNPKILVNFSKKKVVSIQCHRGSKEYQHLIQQGYEDVASVKGPSLVYVDSNYFDPAAKYIRTENGDNEDTVSL